MLIHYRNGLVELNQRRDHSIRGTYRMNLAVHRIALQSFLQSKEMFLVFCGEEYAQIKNLGKACSICMDDALPHFKVVLKTRTLSACT
jgi:hypothetical protein